MNYKLKTILLIFSFFITCIVNAADLKIKLELENVEDLVEKNKDQTDATVYTGETFQIKAIVSGGGRDTPELKIDGLDRLNIEGTSRSTSISIINTDFVSETSYIYDVNADKTGTITIGPAYIEQNGKKIKSKPEQINIRIINRGQGSISKSTSSDSKQLQQEKYELFCQLKTNKKNVVVGEPTILSLCIYSRGKILQVGILPPKISGFIHKEIEPVIKREENIDGKFYNVLEKKFLLLPQEPGELEVPSMSINFQVQTEKRKGRRNVFGDEFFSSFFGPMVETKKAHSNSLQIKVDPLPAHKQPIDGVGNFTSFTAWVNKNEAIINEPIMLNLQIEGEGNLDQIVAPKLRLPSFFTSYESKTDLQENLSSGSTAGKKRFEFIVQADKTGECQIGEQSFTYFDTQSRKFKTLQSNPIKLNIKTPPPEQQSIKKDFSTKEEKEEEISDKPKTDSFQQDIGFIEEDVSFVSKRKEKQLPASIFIIFVFLPFLFYLQNFFVSLFFGIQNKFFGNYSSKKYAAKYKKELDSIVQKQEINKIYQFFLNYFAAKFDVTINEVNENWIEQKLIQIGWPDKKIIEFLNYLNECASFSFAARIKTDVNPKKLLEYGEYWFLLLESNFSEK